MTQTGGLLANQFNGNFLIEYLIQIRQFSKWINSRFKFEKNRMIRESIKILIDSEVNWQTLSVMDDVQWDKSSVRIAQNPIVTTINSRIEV